MNTQDAGRSRRLVRVIVSVPTSDGAGVKLRRSLGSGAGTRLDPFLMLDEFSSDEAADYVAGFPAHPHRGFETVTYMLDGHMLHEDHLGNRGDLRSGDVQWMTAGSGIIHSEMPQQERGRMRGFQLWINLPAREKMKPAAYRDIPAARIPRIELPHGVRVKAIAGTAMVDGVAVSGPVNGPGMRLTTDPLYLDIEMPAGSRSSVSLPDSHQAFVYPYEGDISVGPAGDRRQVAPRTAGILSPGSVLELAAEDAPARAIVLAGRPLNEPVVQYGPFVMNTREEIEQAIHDYQSGALTAAREWTTREK